MDKTQPHPLFKLATELGPLLVFFFVNAKFNLFAATGTFMVAIVAAMVASYVVTRHIPIMAIVTGVVVLVFGVGLLVLARRGSRGARHSRARGNPLRPDLPEHGPPPSRG